MNNSDYGAVFLSADTSRVFCYPFFRVSATISSVPPSVRENSSCPRSASNLEKYLKGDYEQISDTPPEIAAAISFHDPHFLNDLFNLELDQLAADILENHPELLVQVGACLAKRSEDSGYVQVLRGLIEHNDLTALLGYLTGVSEEAVAMRQNTGAFRAVIPEDALEPVRSRHRQLLQEFWERLGDE